MARSADLELRRGEEVITSERGCDEAAEVLLACVPFVARWRSRVRCLCGGSGGVVKAQNTSS